MISGREPKLIESDLERRNRESDQKLEINNDQTSKSGAEKDWELENFADAETENGQGVGAENDQGSKRVENDQESKVIRGWEREGARKVITDRRVIKCPKK